MLTNRQFLKTIQDSFEKFIENGTSRSTGKLKPLHGAIAADLAERIGEGYEVYSQGYGAGKESRINGRYIDKMVDIAVFNRTTGQPVAGIAVKFVMQNYSQNSNNYFENMLGETVNIRSARCPYFQVFIILDRLPYYKSSGELTKWETFTAHNIEKYLRLAEDNTDICMHTPNKTLLFVVHLSPDTDANVKDRKGYLAFYESKKGKIQMELSHNSYGNFAVGGTVLMNDYGKFMEKIYHTIMSV